MRLSEPTTATPRTTWWSRLPSRRRGGLSLQPVTVKPSSRPSLDSEAAFVVCDCNVQDLGVTKALLQDSRAEAAASIVHDHYVPDHAATMTLLQAKPLDTEAPSIVHDLNVRDLAGAEALLQAKTLDVESAMEVRDHYAQELAVTKVLLLQTMALSVKY